MKKTLKTVVMVSLAVIVAVCLARSPSGLKVTEASQPGERILNSMGNRPVLVIVKLSRRTR